MRLIRPKLDHPNTNQCSHNVPFIRKKVIKHQDCDKIIFLFFFKRKLYLVVEWTETTST